MVKVAENGIAVTVVIIQGNLMSGVCLPKDNIWINMGLDPLSWNISALLINAPKQQANLC